MASLHNSKTYQKGEIDMPLISKYAQERYRAINNAFAQDKIDRPKLYEEPINFRIGKAFVKLCYKKYPNSSCYKHFKEVGGGTESGYGYKIITKRGRRFKRRYFNINTQDYNNDWKWKDLVHTLAHYVDKTGKHSDDQASIEWGITRLAIDTWLEKNKLANEQDKLKPIKPKEDRVVKKYKQMIVRQQVWEKKAKSVKTYLTKVNKEIKVYEKRHQDRLEGVV